MNLRFLFCFFLITVTLNIVGLNIMLITCCYQLYVF